MQEKVRFARSALRFASVCNVRSAGLQQGETYNQEDGGRRATRTQSRACVIINVITENVDLEPFDLERCHVAADAPRATKDTMMEPYSQKLPSDETEDRYVPESGILVLPTKGQPFACWLSVLQGPCC